MHVLPQIYRAMTAAVEGSATLQARKVRVLTAEDDVRGVFARDPGKGGLPVLFLAPAGWSTRWATHQTQRWEYRVDCTLYTPHHGHNLGERIVQETISAIARSMSRALIDSARQVSGSVRHTQDGPHVTIWQWSHQFESDWRPTDDMSVPDITLNGSTTKPATGRATVTATGCVSYEETISANIGTVTNNYDGTWDWSYTIPVDQLPGNISVTITATNITGSTDTVTFTITVTSDASSNYDSSSADSSAGSSIAGSSIADSSSADSSIADSSSSSPMLWTPASLTDLVGFWDTSDPDNVTLGASGVSQIDNSTGSNHLVQSTLVNQPGYDETNKTLTFDVAQKEALVSESNSGISGAGASTFFAVVKYAGVDAFVRTFIALGKNANLEARRLAVNNDQFGMFFFSSNLLSNVAPSGGYEILGATYSGSVARLWLNGVQIGSDYSVTANTMNTEVSVGAWKNGIVDLDPLAGEVGSPVVMTSEMTTDQRQRYEGWAAHTYGLTSLLPADHPYKTEAPEA